LPASVSQDELLQQVQRLNHDPPLADIPSTSLLEASIVDYGLSGTTKGNYLVLPDSEKNRNSVNAWPPHAGVDENPLDQSPRPFDWFLKASW
jgi:hypothetical protein